jgi:hypothetical protein
MTEDTKKRPETSQKALETEAIMKKTKKRPEGRGGGK